MSRRPPHYRSPPPPTVAVFRCRQCRAELSDPLRFLGGPPEPWRHGGNPSLVATGHYAIMPGGDTFAGRFAVPIAALVNVGWHPDPRRQIGCCGPSGTAPNRVCACGAEVGTEQSDCFMPHAVYLDPARVTAVAGEVGRVLRWYDDAGAVIGQAELVGIDLPALRRLVGAPASDPLTHPWPFPAARLGELGGRVELPAGLDEYTCTVEADG